MTSIIILSYNTYTYTRRCIESIRRHTEPGTYELIVIDNGSQDESVAWLKQQTDINLVCNQENTGFPGGCNQGLLRARGGGHTFTQQRYGGDTALVETTA